MTNSNPLFDSQREKAGSQTKDKYRYQYHWALHKVLTEHKNRKEYAVFVEFHEDVVICDSLDSSKANFELNQVKTTSKNMSNNELVKLKNKIKGTSVLSKLVSNISHKPYASKIKNLNLVSLYPFTLELKKSGITLQKITLDDLSDNQIKKLEIAIENELGTGTALPQNLQFIVSELSEKNYQNDVIASIVKLISDLYPGSFCNAQDIYRLLIDEINNKGVVTYDFAKWDELLRRKALTSTTINNVINQFTNIKDEAKIASDFKEIADELGLKVLARKRLKTGFDRYFINRLGNKSLLQLEITSAITALINDEINAKEEDIEKLIDNVVNKLNDKYKNSFLTNEDLKGAIICEYIFI